MSRRCPHCGQTFPRPIPLGLKLSPQQFTIFDIVRRAGDNGIATEELITLAYKGCRIPDTATKVVHTVIHRINKQLRPRGYRIRNWGRSVTGTNGEYFFVRIDQANGAVCAS